MSRVRTLSPRVLWVVLGVVVLLAAILIGDLASTRDEKSANPGTATSTPAPVGSGSGPAACASAQSGASGAGGNAATGCYTAKHGTYVPCPTSGSGVVEIGPGDDAQAVIDGNPVATTFHLGTGTFAGFSVKPKAGDRFCGDGIDKTVLDGRGACVSAISAHSDPSVDDVTIKNLTAKNYCTQGSTLHSQVTFYSDGLNNIQQRADGWKVVSTQVSDSNVGVSVGNMSYVAGNRFFHNYRSGMAGGGRASVFEYNTLQQNDWFGRANSIDGDSQGSKSAVTDGVIYRYNYVSDTSGPGLWVDTLNSNCEIAHNYIEHLGDSGVFVEAGYNCSVHDNIIKSVGLQDNAGDQIGDGIEISTAGPVDVYRNYVIDSHQGIVIHQDARGVDTTLGNYHGAFCANGSTVHDNYLLERTFHDDVTNQTLTPSSGWINSSATDGCDSASENHWDRNHYYLDDLKRKAWLINGHASSWSQWRADGRDRAGTRALAAGFPRLPSLPTGQAGYVPVPN
jgi:hypothetical protein